MKIHWKPFRILEGYNNENGFNLFSVEKGLGGSGSSSSKKSRKNW